MQLSFMKSPHIPSLKIDEPIKLLLLGSFFFYYGTFVIFPMIFVWGYIVRLFQSLSDDDSYNIPDFTGWKELFTDGLVAYIIWSVYSVIPLINVYLVSHKEVDAGSIMVAFFILLAGGGILTILIPFGGKALGLYTNDVIPVSTDHLTASALKVGLFQNIIFSIRDNPDTCLLLLLVWYVAPVAIFRYSQTGRLRSGFNFDKTRPYLTSFRYVGAWSIFILVWLVSYLFMLLASPEIPYISDLYQWLINQSIAGVGNLLAQVLLELLRISSFVLFFIAYLYLGRTLAKLNKEIENE